MFRKLSEAPQLTSGLLSCLEVWFPEVWFLEVWFREVWFREVSSPEVSCQAMDLASSDLVRGLLPGLGGRRRPPPGRRSGLLALPGMWPEVEKPRSDRFPERSMDLRLASLRRGPSG